MSTAHMCPVCNGAGTVSRPPHIAGDQQTWTSGSTGPYTCKACTGTGIVWEWAKETLPNSGVSYLASDDDVISNNKETIQ